MQPGDKLWHGGIVTPQIARAYNRATAKIEQFERAGMTAPENIINGRHSLIAWPIDKESSK